MCIDKKQFNSKEESFQKGQRSYLCKHCGKWHRSGQTTKFIVRMINKIKK